MSHPRLLLADEDQTLRAFLAENLSADGYHVDTADDRNHAIHRLRTTTPDLIVADVNGETLALLDWLREADSGLNAAASDTPVIVLTSNGDELHRVRLLERGGDDVIVKPFSYPELRARIAAVLRRTVPRQPRPQLTAGPVRIDLRDRSVSVNERPVQLSAIEYRLLCHLAGEPTRVFTREELMRDVWGYRSAGRTRTLDSHVISSPVWGVGCVDCWFCPSRRRRFISSGVDSALAAVLSPRAKRRGVGAARLSTPPRHRSLSVDFLTYRPSGRVAGWA